MKQQIEGDYERALESHSCEELLELVIKKILKSKRLSEQKSLGLLIKNI